MTTPDTHPGQPQAAPPSRRPADFLAELLATPELATELAAACAGHPATAPVQIRRKLPAGTSDWLDLTPPPGEDFWYWARSDSTHHRLALGHALRLDSAGPRRFAALANAWQGLAAGLPADALTTACLGFAFSPLADGPWPNAQLTLPALCLEHRAGDRQVIFTGLAGLGLANLTRWRALLAQPADALPVRLPEFTAQAQALADQAWQAKVGAALRDIAAGRLDKVVLSRRRRLTADAPLPIMALLATLLRRQPGTTVFAHGRPDGQVFLGATPERLVSLAAGQASADALAGTVWADGPGPFGGKIGGSIGSKSATETKAEGNAEPASIPDAMADKQPTYGAPLSDDKNRREQRLVGAAVQAALAGLCAEVGPLGPPDILRLNGLAHLRNRVGGPVRPGVGLFDLIAGLHPTPAVGGSPASAAQDWLSRHGDERSAWYSGGIGFIRGNGDGEVVVPLRCALIQGRQIELQAGAGIVAGSDPAREFLETEAKMGALLDALSHLDANGPDGKPADPQDNDHAALLLSRTA